MSISLKEPAIHSDEHNALTASSSPSQEATIVDRQSLTRPQFVELPNYKDIDSKVRSAGRTIGTNDALETDAMRDQASRSYHDISQPCEKRAWAKLSPDKRSDGSHGSINSVSIPSEEPNFIYPSTIQMISVTISLCLSTLPVEL